MQDQHQKTLELIKQISMFQDLKEEDLEKMCKLLVLKDYTKDSMIVNQEEMGDALYIIYSGKVKVVLYGESGREIILSIFKPGDFFGEMSLFDGQPRSANVLALEPSKLLVLTRSVFMTHLNECPSTAINILSEMSRRLRHADEIIGNLALMDVYGRVARLLMDLVKSEGEEIEDGFLIKDRPTQQDIASMVGTSRETVSRALKELARLGYISAKGKTFIVKRAFFLEEDFQR